MAPGMCGHGYEPLSQSVIRSYEKWTNNNYDWSRFFLIITEQSRHVFIFMVCIFETKCQTATKSPLFTCDTIYNLSNCMRNIVRKKYFF